MRRLIPRGRGAAAEIVARPRDAVAWALYYPPILAELAGGGAPPARCRPGCRPRSSGSPPTTTPARWPRSTPCPRRRAMRATIPTAPGVLLNVGRVEEAEAAIERALALDPEAGEALAQRAIIQVVQNRQAEALADARRAVELSPDFGAAADRPVLRPAGDFQLEEARAVLREAVERSPEDALAWARLAELEQMFGDLGASRDAAERAVALAPELARTQMVLGFAALTRIDIDEAKAAFERAIALDSANPLPRLGLGLAKIRSGDLEAGGREIEIAAALDPNNSLIRSYLGKAYFEERRDPLDAEQFAIAKELDPNDPTPWFYDAIRLQTENRPVEALRNLERSIELNDNRAVYRSRLLLDEDRATRGVSLARIYDDLGFEQLGVSRGDASRSTLDPANSVRAPLPLRHLRRPAAPRDRAGQRAAAGAAAAAGQHQSGPAEPRRHRSQYRRRRRARPRPPSTSSRRCSSATKRSYLLHCSPATTIPSAMKPLYRDSIITSRFPPDNYTRRPTAFGRTTMSTTTSTTSSLRSMLPPHSVCKPRFDIGTPARVTSC